MSGPWAVVFYRDSRGLEPVRAWLDELAARSPSEYGTVRHHLDLLEEFGVYLEEPYTRQLAGKLESFARDRGGSHTSPIRSDGWSFSRASASVAREPTAARSTGH